LATFTSDPTGPKLTPSAFDYTFTAASTGLTTSSPSAKFDIVDAQASCAANAACAGTASVSTGGTTAAATFGTGASATNLTVTLGAADAPVFECNGYPKGTSPVSQFAFTGGRPHQAVHRGQACIQCELPTLMLAAQQRRAATRVEVPVRAPVTCTVRMGPVTFDTQVADISLDGMGILVSDSAIPACAGTRLEHARIRHPQSEPIAVDLEVRYVTRVKLPNGERVSRLGCKIIGSPQHLEELIRLFIVDLQ
jgi:hypothetical protein